MNNISGKLDNYHRQSHSYTFQVWIHPNNLDTKDRMSPKSRLNHLHFYYYHTYIFAFSFLSHKRDNINNIIAVLPKSQFCPNKIIEHKNYLI